jgi:hypothetical protein
MGWLVVYEYVEPLADTGEGGIHFLQADILV